MQRIEFKEAPCDMTTHEVLWTNVKIAVACSNNSILNNAIAAWIKYNRERGYQYLERKFRKHNIDVYILAKPTTPKDRRTMRFVDQFTLKELKYQLTFLMKDEDVAMAEILKHHNDYDENFRKIADAGIPVERGTLIELKRSGYNMFTFNSNNMFNNLSSGKMLMHPIRVNLETEFNNTFQKYQNSDYKLSTKLYDKNGNGEEIFAMMGEKNGVTKCLTSIGIMMGNPNTGDEQDIKFVLLQDKDTWTWDDDMDKITPEEKKRIEDEKKRLAEEEKKKEEELKRKAEEEKRQAEADAEVEEEEESDEDDEESDEESE